VHYTTSCNTKSSAPEDGRDQRPRHVGLIGMINKPLQLHLVGVYIIYINDARSNKYQIKKPKSAGNLLREICLLIQLTSNSLCHITSSSKFMLWKPKIIGYINYTVSTDMKNHIFSIAVHQYWYIGTKYVIFAKNWMWLPEDGSMW